MRPLPAPGTALVIGAGKIGRGFVAHLLARSGWRVLFADASAALVESLQTETSFTVHILGRPDLDEQVSGYEACQLESPRFDQFWSASDAVFTAAGGANLAAIAGRIAKAVQLVGVGSTPTKNVITCENWDQPSEQLRALVRNDLEPEQRDLLDGRVGFADAVVMRVAVDPPLDPTDDSRLDVWVNDYWQLPLDEAGLKGGCPRVEGLEPLANFGGFLRRKLYTNNTSNAVIAYNGYLAGYTHTAEAALSPEVGSLLDEAYNEINAMCVAEFGVDPADQDRFARSARAKYSNPQIVDRLTRHARDPIRKLGPRDRLIAPARLCLSHGVTPAAIVTTIVAALRYDEPSDPSARRLQHLIAQHGLPHALITVCELDPHEPLFDLILKESADDN